MGQAAKRRYPPYGILDKADNKGSPRQGRTRKGKPLLDNISRHKRHTAKFLFVLGCAEFGDFRYTHLEVVVAADLVNNTRYQGGVSSILAYSIPFLMCGVTTATAVTAALDSSIWPRSINSENWKWSLCTPRMVSLWAATRSEYSIT